MQDKENIFMARIGKIARLPRDLRSTLNSRLQDGEEGKKILHWLNALPPVKQVLAENFGGRPINEQNLSDWRRGGYEEWLAHQDILVQAQELAANRKELEAAAPGRSLTDHLGDAVSFRYGAILAAQGLEFDDTARQQLRILGRLCQAVVKLRRSEQNAARLKIESERWDLARQQLEEDKAEAVKQKQRDALTARFWGELRKGERIEKYGMGPATKLALDIINEVETCEDPAHFQSKVLAAVSPAELKRASAEYVKNRPARRPEVQAAMDTYTDMTNFLAQNRRVRSGQPPTKPRGRARKPAPRPATAPAAGGSGDPPDGAGNLPAPSDPPLAAPACPAKASGDGGSPGEGGSPIKANQG